MEKLNEFRRYFLFLKFVENIFIFLTLFLFLFLFCVLFKFSFYFTFFSFLSFLYFIKNFIEANYFKIARKIERKIKELDEKIVTYIEFKKSENERKREIAKKLEKIFEKYDFKRAYPFSEVFPGIRLFIYSLIYFLLFFALFPYEFARYYAGEIRPPLYLKIEPSEGIFFVPKTLTIKAIPYGKEVDLLEIDYTIKGKRNFEKMERVDGVFTYSLNVFEPAILKYRVKSGRYRTDEREILFKERPFLKFWKAYLKIPGRSIDTIYSPDKINIFENGYLDLEFEFGGDLDSGYVLLDGVVLSKFSGKNFKLSLIKKGGVLNFVYFTGDVKTYDPRAIEIIKAQDSPPFIYIIFPPFDQEIGEDMKIPFAIYLMDDISLKYLDLVYEFKEKELKRIREYKNEKEDTVFYNLDFSHLPLLPGDTVKVWFKVADKGFDGKSQVSESRVYKFWIPTYTEIYKEASSEMNEGISFLREEGREVGEFLRDLKAFKEKIKDFKDKEKIEDFKEMVQNIEKSLEEISRKFDEYSKKIENLLKRYPLDAELQEKLFKLRELFKEIMTPDLEKIFNEIKEAFKKLNPEEIQEAYNKLLLDKELLKEQIERTLEFLERVKQEVKMREFIEKMKEMEREMEKFLLSSEYSMKDLEEIKEKMQEISGEMKELSESFKGEESKIGEELKSAGKDLEESISELNLSMGLFHDGNLSECNGRIGSSKKSLEKAREKTESALQNLLSMRRKMQMGEMEEIFLSSVLLSKKQYEISEMIGKKEEGVESMEEEIGANRESLKKFKNKTAQIAKKNINFPKNVLNYVFSAYFKSEELYEKMKIMEFEKLKEISEEIARYLNLTALEILRLQGEGEGGASQALIQALKRLSEIAREQSGINALTQSLLPLEIGEAPSQEFLKSVERIAGMQKSLAEKLKEVLESLKEAGGTEGIERQIEKTIEEMEKVAEEIERGEIKREIIERQERILSRMLEVQRSVYKREFTKKRYAERAKPFSPFPPPDRIVEEDEIVRRSIIKVLNSNMPYEDKKIFIDYLNSLLK